jgi:hypothetical protein
MYPFDPPDDMTDEGSYGNWVEDNSVLINREFTRVTADALSDPQPTVHWMQLGILDDEARQLDMLYEGRVHYPILDHDTGGLDVLVAMISLAEEAYRVGDRALALEISTDVNLRLALWDVDTESLSPLLKAAYRRDREKWKDHKETLTRLLGGPCETTIRTWLPPGETKEMLVRNCVEPDSALWEATAIYRRTDETTKEGNLIYVFERITYK